MEAAAATAASAGSGEGEAEMRRHQREVASPGEHMMIVLAQKVPIGTSRLERG